MARRLNAHLAGAVFGIAGDFWFGAGGYAAALAFHCAGAIAVSSEMALYSAPVWCCKMNVSQSARSGKVV